MEFFFFYGCEGWSLTVIMEKSLKGTYTRMLCRVLNTSWRDQSHQRRNVERPPNFVRQDRIQKAWSCCLLPPSLRIVSQPVCPVAANTRTPTTRSLSVYIQRHPDEGRWGGIHQPPLSLHGQQSGLGGQSTSSAEAAWVNEWMVCLRFGVDPLNWPSFIHIRDTANSSPAWCNRGLPLDKYRIIT